MNPLGLFQLFIVVGEAIGEAFGRKPRKEKKSDRIWFAVFYASFIVLATAILIRVVYSLYFAKSGP